MIMLTKNNGKSRRLRWGVVGLSVFVPLAFPAAASAAQGPTATGESIQYVNVNVNPPSGTRASDYDNSVSLTSGKNGHALFDVKYRLWDSNAPIVTADNYAQAAVSGCSHCGATAIAFQVVLVSKQKLAQLTADDSALGTTTGCTTCNSLAEAFQIVYATDQASLVGTTVKLKANGTASELRDLQYSRLSTAQVQSRSTTLVNNLINSLQASSGGSNGSGRSPWTPGINGASQPAALTSNTQPVIDLLSEIQH
jgi:hypothetical protein